MTTSAQTKRPVSSSVSKFSTTAKPGSAVCNCPPAGKAGGKSTATGPKPPGKPCNLLSLQIVESNAKPKGESGTRNVELRAGIKRNRRTSPTQLVMGSTFQITAPSADQDARKLVVSVPHEAWCGMAQHQQIVLSATSTTKEYQGTTANLEFHRRPFPADDGVLIGTWAVMDDSFNADESALVYYLKSRSCGLPSAAASAPLEDAMACIEVWPADKYKLELTFPAIKEADLVDAKSDAFRTKTEVKADAFHDSRGVQTLDRDQYREFFTEQRKKDFKTNYADKLECKFTHTNGGRVRTVQIDDIVRMVALIADTQYAIRKMSKWWDSFSSVGPGVSVSIQLSFLAGSVEAEWGLKEYVDDRVFNAWSMALNLDVVKGEIKIFGGIRCGGLADLFVELGGEGALGFAIEFKKDIPDDEQEVTSDNPLKPRGEFTLKGFLKSSFMWLVKGEVGLQCDFKLDFEGLEVCKNGHVLHGPLKLKREPLYRVISYSSRAYGMAGTDQSKEKLVDGASYTVWDFGGSV